VTHPRATTLPIFPLNTVLFPGGRLPLRIFEQRYLAMTKACLKDDSPFGVCLISEGGEVGQPATPADVGCIARITAWEMPSLGIFELMTRGEERFRLMNTRAGEDGLIIGEIVALEAEPPATVADRHHVSVEVLERVIAKFGEEHFPPPHRFEDATWVGYRLAELLPLSLVEKQRLLVSNDAIARLDRITELLNRG
jgi:Lon protease-like protein